MKIGDTLKGTITGIQPYGAFVELEDGTTGLIHISEIKTGFVENIHNDIKIGQEVRVQVIDVDEYSAKASLSLRTLEDEKKRDTRHRRFTNERYKIGFLPLAKQLPLWVRESKEFLRQQKEAATRV